MDERKVWDRLAGRYDTIVKLFDKSYPAVAERLGRDLPSEARVLEVAAGTGQFTPALAGLAREVVATDVSPEMVERLGHHVAGADIPNVACAVMSAYELDTPDSSFDVVFCANALHVMEEPHRALREFHRVLRPDGVLIAPTFLHGADPARRAVSQVLSLVSPFVAHTRFDLDRLAKAIGAERFQVVTAEQLPGVFPLGYVVARRGGWSAMTQTAQRCSTVPSQVVA